MQHINIRPRNIFLKENIRLCSNNEYKQALLTGYLSFFSIGLGVFYIIYDSLYQLDDTLIYYCLLIVSGSLSWRLNRQGTHFLAKAILLITGILVIYESSSKSALQTDAHLFYLVICLAAYALFGYEKRKAAFIFSLLSLSAFGLSLASDILNVQQIEYTREYIEANQIINFICVAVTASMILFVLAKVNFESEESLRAKQKEIESQNKSLTKANAELDRFVYSASHDLRSPLTSILGLVNVAKCSDNPREVVRCLDMINSRVHRLDDLIKDMVNYSRNLRAEIDKQEVNVYQAIHEILEDFHVEELKHAIEFQIHVPVDASVVTDPARLKIILSNLIDNSIKHHDRHNSVPFVAVDFNTNGQGLNTITVSDNGPGIAQEYQAKVFDMFYRANDRAEGSGLGLYIVKETTTKLSGSIQLESSLGKGSAFTVTLPA